MSKHGLLCGYAPPEVVDYGNLVEITAAAHLLMGAADMSDLSFSSPVTPGSGGEPGSGALGGDQGGLVTLGETGGSGNAPGTASGGVAGGGVGSGGGASGGGGAGGGHLPFTGLAVGAVAAIGSGMAAGGAALRRASRRLPRP